MIEDKPSVSIIGKGAVGSALYGFFSENGFYIKSEWNSRSGRIFREQRSEPLYVDRNLPVSSEELGDLIFITTPDDVIAGVAESLAVLPINWREKSVVHTSGNITSSVLGLLKKEGASVASMHPIQTFRKGDGSERFEHIYVSLEGDKELCLFLEKMVELMKARSVFLTPDQKSQLHIAAVFSSNYVTALMHKMENFLIEAEVDDGIKVLEPLVKQVISNIFEKGAAESLTGPISRGDIDSVQKHLELLKHDKELIELYKKLGAEALKIAKKRKAVPEIRLKKLQDIFGRG